MGLRGLQISVHIFTTTLREKHIIIYLFMLEWSVSYHSDNHNRFQTDLFIDNCYRPHY